MGRLNLNEIEEYYSEDSGYDRDNVERKKKKLSTIYKRQARKDKNEKL